MNHNDVEDIDIRILQEFRTWAFPQAATPAALKLFHLDNDSPGGISTALAVSVKDLKAISIHIRDYNSPFAIINPALLLWEWNDSLQESAAPSDDETPVKTSGSETTEASSSGNDRTDSGGVTTPIDPTPTTPVKTRVSAQYTTPVRLIAGSSFAQTPASVFGIGRLAVSDDGNNGGEYSGNKRQGATPRTPRTQKDKATIAPLDSSIAANWDMSARKKALILKLLDVHSEFTYAMRRMPSTFRYGSGENMDRLVSGGQPVTVILVGRISHLYFETTKLAAKVNVVPLLSEDFAIASTLIARYSQPVEQPKDYPSIRASVNQIKEPGTSTYKVFNEICDATCGLKRKEAEGAKLEEDLSISGLVAFELDIKRYSHQNEKARHTSFELVAVQLLRRGDANDIDEVQTSVMPAKRDAFGDDCFSALLYETRENLASTFGLVGLSLNDVPQ
ncbi:hypothetical protein FRC01_002948 [Tulasnella sp. 417]|nr:hypothetical protein FRC01_002948 [Tulasnella sp. 417]